jgi:hypothetical protein
MTVEPVSFGFAVEIDNVDRLVENLRSDNDAARWMSEEIRLR